MKDEEKAPGWVLLVLALAAWLIAIAVFSCSYELAKVVI